MLCSATVQASRNSAVRAVNQTLVLTYFEIDRIKIEEEQKVKAEQHTKKNF